MATTRAWHRGTRLCASALGLQRDERVRAVSNPRWTTQRGPTNASANPRTSADSRAVTTARISLTVPASDVQRQQHGHGRATHRRWRALPPAHRQQGSAGTCVHIVPRNQKLIHSQQLPRTPQPSEFIQRRFSLRSAVAETSLQCQSNLHLTVVNSSSSPVFFALINDRRLPKHAAFWLICSSRRRV